VLNACADVIQAARSATAMHPSTCESPHPETIVLSLPDHSDGYPLLVPRRAAAHRAIRNLPGARVRGDRWSYCLVASKFPVEPFEGCVVPELSTSA
jgi:hypothetical protein